MTMNIYEYNHNMQIWNKNMKKNDPCSDECYFCKYANKAGK